jgi:Protein of unknown function (DUF559)
MKRQPLPARLKNATFTTRTARAYGVTEKRLRAHDLDDRVWGVRTTGVPKTTEHLCQMFSLRLGAHTFFSHGTAALLYAVPLPWDIERDAMLHVSVRHPARAPHAAGIRGHSLAVTESDVCTRRGLQLTSPARTWWDLSTRLDLPDLVAAGDHLVRPALGLATIDDLAAICDAHRGDRGHRIASAAVPLLDGGAESRPESHLRLIIVLAGLPHPRINHAIVYTDGGTVVRPDFEFTEYLTLVEYQGDYHRLTRAQWRKDMTRRSRLEAAGWTVIELNADDLKDPAEVVARITAALRRHGWR